MAKRGYVYILANRKHGTLYTGVTSNLHARVHQHRKGTGSAFTRRYNVTRLVYVEEFGLITEAIRRESTIKGWPRAWKIRTIEAVNPDWLDLTESI
jgi:putative endonuclease